MEYTTAFFDAVKNRRASEGPTDLISRKRYNSKDYRHQLMRDIAEVEIGVARPTTNGMSRCYRQPAFAWMGVKTVCSRMARYRFCLRVCRSKIEWPPTDRFRFKRSGQADTNGNHRQLGADDRLGQWGAVGVQRTLGEPHTASREL